MPFCKICFDLGRSNFNNHNVRDSARNTTCPYLLNTKCRNCGYCGHTAKYCKMLPQLNPLLKKPAPKHIEIVKQPTKPNNAFELLCMELDDDEEVNKDDEEVNKDDEVDEEENQLPDLSKVLWGKAQGKKSWADQVEAEEKKPRSWAHVVVR